MPSLTPRPAIAGLLLALLGAPTRADELDEVLALFAGHRHGAASFVEQHFVHLLSRPVESLGELRFDAPDRLEMRMLEPRPEDWLVEGDTLTLTRRGHTHVAALTDHPQLRPLIDSIRGTLAGDRRALEHVFTVHFLGDPGHWSLVLVPLAGQPDAQIRQVQIDGVRDRLLEVDLRESDGDRTVLTLRTHEGR
jgi:hypothetical protein